ncbi:MAG: ferrous iron transport protein A [Phycisphaerae bacterium]|nr:ferrous iron transport protein A [Phycisphaerae bacterium]
MGKRRRHRAGRHGEHDGIPSNANAPRPLCDCDEGEGGVIVSNGDLKSMEMGLYLGAYVEVLKNHHRDSNMVVAVGPARYAIARSTARLIFVQ